MSVMVAIDLAQRLRQLRVSPFSGGQEVVEEAATAILELQRQVRRLEMEKTDKGQFDAGYRKAQHDIRDALGIGATRG